MAKKRRSPLRRRRSPRNSHRGTGSSSNARARASASGATSSGRARRTTPPEEPTAPSDPRASPASDRITSRSPRRHGANPYASAYRRVPQAPGTGGAHWRTGGSSLAMGSIERRVLRVRSEERLLAALAADHVVPQALGVGAEH